MEHQRPNKPYAVSVGREEHRRLKMLSAELSCSMTDLVNEQINKLWDAHKKEKDNNGKKETRVLQSASR